MSLQDDSKTVTLNPTLARAQFERLFVQVNLATPVQYDVLAGITEIGVPVGINVNVVATVRNVGASAGTLYIEVLQNGTPLWSWSGVLNPGEVETALPLLLAAQHPLTMPNASVVITVNCGHE